MQSPGDRHRQQAQLDAQVCARAFILHSLQLLLLTVSLIKGTPFLKICMHLMYIDSSGVIQLGSKQTLPNYWQRSPVTSKKWKQPTKKLIMDHKTTLNGPLLPNYHLGL